MYEELDLNTQRFQNYIFNFNTFRDKDETSKFNLISKLRLLNQSISYLKFDILDILDDLSLGGCILSKDLEERLHDENITNNLIKDVSPILLYYLINRKK